MNPIMRITEKAAEYLEDLLATRPRSKNHYLRLVPGRATIGLILDKARDDDKIIRVGGVPILLLQPVVASVVEGTTLDFSDDRRLTIIR